MRRIFHVTASATLKPCIAVMPAAFTFKKKVVKVDSAQREHSGSAPVFILQVNTLRRSPLLFDLESVFSKHEGVVYVRARMQRGNLSGELRRNPVPKRILTWFFFKWNTSGHAKSRPTTRWRTKYERWRFRHLGFLRARQWKLMMRFVEWTGNSWTRLENYLLLRGSRAECA